MSDTLCPTHMSLEDLCPLSRQRRRGSDASLARERLQTSRPRDLTASPTMRTAEITPQSSTETYASTVPSEEDYEGCLPLFEQPETASRPKLVYPRVSSSRDFAMYFPSTRTISIRHDDATLDGNMNLRLGTEARTEDGTPLDLTLFHLRMYDLKRREFSLRRYCRDSGREVCHSKRKAISAPSSRRPGFQRSVSNAFTNLRSRSDNKTGTTVSLSTPDSGYDSMSDDGSGSPPRPSGRAVKEVASTNAVCLEFSNYAHLEVARRGSKASKRYEFEYWARKYAWRRAVKTTGDFKATSYHLIDMTTNISIAHIAPIPMSHSETQYEEAKGG